MKLLLDTHVWVWSLENPGKLRPRVATALRSGKTELWLSSVSVWETLLLIDRGRLSVRSGTAHAWVQEALQRVPLREAPVTHAVALASRTIELDHEDPADRFLAATARVFDLTLVTSDERLLRGRGYRTLSNA